MAPQAPAVRPLPVSNLDLAPERSRAFAKADERARRVSHS